MKSKNPMEVRDAISQIAATLQVAVVEVSEPECVLCVCWVCGVATWETGEVQGEMRKSAMDHCHHNRHRGIYLLPARSKNSPKHSQPRFFFFKSDNAEEGLLRRVLQAFC